MRFQGKIPLWGRGCLQHRSYYYYFKLSFKMGKKQNTFTYWLHLLRILALPIFVISWPSTSTSVFASFFPSLALALLFYLQSCSHFCALLYSSTPNRHGICCTCEFLYLACCGCVFCFSLKVCMFNKLFKIWLTC